MLISPCNGHLLYWISMWLTPVCETVDSSNSPQTYDYLTNVRYRTKTSTSELFCASSFFDRNRILRIVDIVELWLVDNWTCHCMFVHGPFSVVRNPDRQHVWRLWNARTQVDYVHWTERLPEITAMPLPLILVYVVSGWRYFPPTCTLSVINGLMRTQALRVNKDSSQRKLSSYSRLSVSDPRLFRY